MLTGYERQDPLTRPITIREREVVRLVRQGLGNRSIAKQMGVREGTIKGHLHSIFRKTGVANRTQLALRAAELIGD